jgi:hypothetical protein
MAMGRPKPARELSSHEREQLESFARSIEEDLTPPVVTRCVLEG